MLRGCRLKVLVFAETGPPLSQNGDVLNADPLVAQNRRLSTSHGRNLHEGRVELPILVLCEI